MRKRIPLVWTLAFVGWLGCSSDEKTTPRAIINEGPTCIGARTPGFWCQNQDGKNPNLGAAEFQVLAAEAATLLAAVPALNTATEISTAVCNTRDQLLRHLAATALNLASNGIDEDTPLTGEAFATVGTAVQQAISVATDATATKSDRNAIKDVLDRINNNTNTVLGDECRRDDDDDDDDDDGDDGDDDGGTCVGGRTPGFYCQNQDGHPELSAAEFDRAAIEAARLLSRVAALDTADEVAAAVCDTSEQLLRHLAAAALNVAVGWLDEDTPLAGEPYADVGAAIAAGIDAARSGSAANREPVKDVLDRLNNGISTRPGNECPADGS